MTIGTPGAALFQHRHAGTGQGQGVKYLYLLDPSAAGSVGQGRLPPVHMGPALSASAGSSRSYPIAAIYGDTPSVPRGPAVQPGTYKVKLTVQGQSYTQPLTVKMDPRVKTPAEGLKQQFELSMQCYNGIRQVHEARQQIGKLRTQLKERRDKVDKGPIADAIEKLDAAVAALESPAAKGKPGSGQPNLQRVMTELSQLLGILQGADATPTTQAVAACAEAQQAVGKLLARWNELKGTDVKALQVQLRGAGLPPLVLD